MGWVCISAIGCGQNGRVFTSAGRRRCVAGNGSFRAAKCKTTANLIAIMSSSTVRQRSVGDELREKRKGNTSNIACNTLTRSLVCVPNTSAKRKCSNVLIIHCITANHASFIHFNFLLQNFLTEQRQLKKIKNDTETKKRRRIILWSIALILLLSLSVYYYNYKPSKTRQQASTDSSPSSAPSSTPNENPKANDQSSKKTLPKTPPKSKKNQDSPKKDEHPPPPKRPPPPKSTDEVLNTKINDLPILRRPIPPSDPDRPLIMEILEADDFLRVGDYAQALEKFKKILKRFKQSPRGLLGRGLALEGLGKTKESVKYLDKAIDTYYNLAFESGPLANEDIRLAALLGLAECSERRRKTKILIKALKKAVEMEPKHELYATKLAQAYMKGTQMERAQKLLEEVVDKWPGNSLAHANLGYLLYRGGSYEEALPHLVKGLVENKEVQRNGKFYLYTGETLTKLNKSEEVSLIYVTSSNIKTGVRSIACLITYSFIACITMQSNEISLCPP